MWAVETKVKVAVGLALAFIALNVVDILLTWHALHLGAIEAVPYMSKVLELGFWGSVSFKLGVSAGIAAIMLDRGQLGLLISIASIFCLICIWNLVIIIVALS